MSLWKDRFLSPIEIAEMENVFREKYINNFKDDEDIIFEGYVSENSLFINAILKNSDETYYYPFETFVKADENLNINEKDARLYLLDFIDDYFDKFFKSSRNTFIPIDWTNFKFREINIFAKAQLLNKEVEAFADELLEKNGYDVNGDLKEHKKCQE